MFVNYTKTWNTKSQTLRKICSPQHRGSIEDHGFCQELNQGLLSTSSADKTLTASFWQGHIYIGAKADHTTDFCYSQWTPIHLNRLLLVLDSANEMTSTKIRSEVACPPIQHLSVEDNEHIQRRTLSPPAPSPSSPSSSPTSPVSRPSQCMAPSAHTCTGPSTGTRTSPSRSSKDGETTCQRKGWEAFETYFLVAICKFDQILSLNQNEGLTSAYPCIWVQTSEPLLIVVTW